MPKRTRDRRDEREAQEQLIEDERLARSLAQSTFECNICQDVLPEDDVFVVDRCEHKLCRGCMAGHIDSEIGGRHVPVRCPMCIHERPGDVTVLSEMDAKMVLDEDQIRRYDNASLRNAVEGSEAFHVCNEADCPGVAELVEDRVHFLCPLCTTGRCVRCNVPWHHGQTCEQYQQWRRENEQGDDLMARAVEGHDLAVCPQCGQGVCKSEGCNHMTCRCGCHFCYLCNEDIGSNYRRHYERTSCDLFSGSVYDRDD